MICNEVKGIVIENFKLPGDICVEWETGLKTSYDVDWLDEFARIVDPEKCPEKYFEKNKKIV